MRRPLALVLALVLLGMVAAPVSALTTQRTWTAGMGSSWYSGRTQLQAYADGTGLASVTYQHLKRNVSYRIDIRAGRCTSLGSVLTTVGWVKTDANGAVTTTRVVPQWRMNDIWGYARTGSIAVRIATVGSSVCGNFSFPRATRVRIPGYSIDLPVIPGNSGYPYCNVAMYQKVLWQPTEPGVSFIYSHARKGMFLPLLTASKINNGAAMVGKLVYVYTSDSKIHTYRITKVRRHVSSIQSAVGITSEKLWLQTSEGPNYTYPKLIIEADRIASGPAAYSSSHPTPHPVTCG